jgi:hypothetical protein
MLIDHQKGIVDVWHAFNNGCRQPFPYPQDNTTPFEEWFFDSFTQADVRERIYLPIFWTGYYIRANYGKHKAAIDHLQGYLSFLDPGKKYYTIVQYDDGILNCLKHLDIRVFSMSGPPMDYPLPLICRPHKFEFNEQKDIYLSFVGRATHPLRERLIKDLAGFEDCYITTQPHSLEEYCRIMARSVYALCPRGYGPTSFRIMEALQYGAIPVYISDKPIIPHIINSFPGLSIEADETMDSTPLIKMLNSHDDYRDQMVAGIQYAFEKYFSYEGTKRLILENLIHEDTGNHRAKAN